ncbi:MULTISPECIES: winged helix-turn-helix domain-containing protein [unclassified Streptomyces]|uniref:winged helix-turn-helix domain-containing protein n=1 Tax=Streptomyces sp. NBC_01180 TaxID=2903763 RepID=UPI002E0D5C11|nr:winged helix-turn-helix domain-containing protein [Streptomyces sp. NBC_01197]WSS52076.1 winged helix-turn-helix domain-containing protein [Streptomyces sp. NBC_01180]
MNTVIGRRFHLTYTIQGVRKPLVRNGWSCQVPARRAMERDDEAVAVWKAEVYPQVWVCVGGRGRVTVAGVVCFKPGHLSRFFYRLTSTAPARARRKSFAWQDYRDFLDVTHLQLGGPVVWCWDNLNVHLADGLAESALEYCDWLEIYQFPSYAPDLNPQEGVWSLVKRGLANFADRQPRPPPAGHEEKAQQDPVSPPPIAAAPRPD